MNINDEGRSNAAYWYERAMKAEARLAEEESAHRVTAGIFASTLVRADAAEARLAEAVAALQAFSDYLGPLEYNRILALGITVSASVRRCDAPGCDHWERHGRACETCTTSTVTADTEAK
jgi:hypothetical protein